MKKKLANILLCIAFMLCVGITIKTSTVNVYAAVPEAGSTANFDELADNVELGIESTQDRVGRIGSSLASLVAIGLLVSLIWVRQPRKVELVLGGLKIVGLAFVAIQIVSKGWIFKFLSGLVDKYFS